MRIIFCALVISIIVAPAKAAEICDDLFSVSCSQDGSGAKDPSGKILSGSEMKTKIAEARKKLQPKLLELSRKNLSADADLNKSLNRMLKCKDDCAKVSAQALAAILERDAVHGEGRFEYQNLQLMDVYGIIQHKSYANLQLQAQNELRELLASKKERGEIENDLFNEIRALVIERVKKLQLDENVKNAILSRLDKIKFRAGECGRISGDELYPQTLSFGAKNDDLRICDATLAKVTSKITLALMIAHDLGHPFDPCHISDGREKIMSYVINNPLRSRDSQYPLADLLKCLRGPRSAFAREAPQGKECANDQINESFADWLAAEIIPEYIAQKFPSATREQRRAAYINAMWTSCSGIKAGSYPLGMIRANALIAMNPKVREQLECPKDHPKYSYCDSPAAGQGRAHSASGVVK